VSALCEVGEEGVTCSRLLVAVAAAPACVDSDVRPSLAPTGPLLEWAEAAVPRRQWAQTPVFLFGTAGLRKLR
jgi:hypothetical protein